MTEKVLDYDRTIVPQETGWFCGPASVQVVLNSHGIRATEQQMALELGTHRGGTDSVKQFPPVLNKYLKDAGYFWVSVPNDPATDTQKEKLWLDLVGSINAGHGVIANFQVPPSNYPRGVKGSKSPYYAGGTVYHYVSAMGYDDTPGARAVWIADSGFQPQGYWMSFDQFVSAIAVKGYVATGGPVDAPPIPDVVKPVVRSLTVENFAKGMGNSLTMERYSQLLPAFTEAMIQAEITNVNRAAMWFAQLGHESSGLRHMEEIASGAAYEGRQDLGNIIQGDGVRFKGRGPIQITGRHNYTALSKWAHAKGYVPTSTFFVDNPPALADDRYGFLGPVWYWTVARPDINALCDAGQLETVTRRINGGLNGLPDRTQRYRKAIAMGEALLPGSNDDSAIWEKIAEALGIPT